MSLTQQILSQQPDNVLERLRGADGFWHKFRTGSIPVPQVVETKNDNLDQLDWDIVISGGTLGILLAAALQKQGWQVVLIEKGILKGRKQEWNISRSELEVLVELELLSKAELEQAIATQYNPARVSFLGGKDIWVEDVLNIGVDPVTLLDLLKQKFLLHGGQLYEQNAFKAATICNNGILVTTDKEQFKVRLLIDAMGNFSPIALQARGGKKPDGVCVVVGSCATGYPANDSGDLIASFTPIINQCQYFWEAFPARDGRTTYMFSYIDADPQRPSLEYFMEEYLRLLPQYQNVELNQLQFQRFLFSFFPSYRQSPLHLPFNRILAVGDSSGGQSPVSFGGFGAMIRHLARLAYGITEALKTDRLSQSDLALLQPYQPNISVTWLFQKTMSVGINQQVNPDQINDLMNGVFEVMDKLGDDVLKPFLQDVVQFSSLSKTLPQVNPKLVLPILSQVGIKPLVDWSIHYFNLAAYTGLYPIGFAARKIVKLPQSQQYYYHRWLDAWKYGAGYDYHS